MFVNVQNNMSLSMNKMRKLTNFVRATVGRKSVPTNILNHLSKQSKLMKDIYKIDFDEFDVDDSADKKVRPVIYEDSSELLDFVISERKNGGKCYCSSNVRWRKRFF